MRVFAAFWPVFVIFLLLSCSDGKAQVDHQSEWREVLRHKKAATAEDASAEQRQIYADSVQAFVERHPDHRRAREVWNRLQLEFADDLAALGRHQDAIRFYRAVLEHEPESEQAREGLARSIERMALTREKLLELRKGMSRREVTSILGLPLPGWTATRERPEADIEAWYYPTRDGAVAGVYFRDGKVFAAEETSDSKLGRLGS